MTKKRDRRYGPKKGTPNIAARTPPSTHRTFQVKAGANKKEKIAVLAYCAAFGVSETEMIRTLVIDPCVKWHVKVSR